MSESSELPAVLAGPLLRRLEPTRIVFWLVASEPLQAELQLSCAGVSADINCTVVPIGRHAFVHLLDINLDSPLPCDAQIDYDLILNTQSIAQYAPHLLYPARNGRTSSCARTLSNCSTAHAANPITRQQTACCAPTACCWNTPRRCSALPC